MMDPRTCVSCRSLRKAEIRDLRTYDNHKVPVWYCEKCNTAIPPHQRDRYLWVDNYSWDPPGFIYGDRINPELKCHGCANGKMYANNELFLLEAFPFHEETKPAWTCYLCGYSDKVAKGDGYLWADMFGGWRER